MCSYQEWERVTRRVQEAVDEGQLREFVADAAARVEAFARRPEELRVRAGGRGLGSRARPAIGN